MEKRYSMHPGSRILTFDDDKGLGIADHFLFPDLRSAHN